MSDSTPPASKLIKTPRFPDGISVGNLRQESLPVQKETMATWFLAHYVPATGTYFGFAEPGQGSAILNTSPLNTFALNQGPRIAGFGQGTWLNGGRAPELLRKVFEEGVGRAPTDEVAALFEGLWEMKPEKPVVALTKTDVEAAIAAALDAFEVQFRSLVPEHGGIGHNHPPEDEPITPEEQVTVLRAIGDMRHAISSGADFAVLDTVWSGVSNVIGKIGAWSLKHINLFFDNFSPAAGKAMGEKWPYLVLAAVDVWLEGAHITDLISVLLKLK
jgi:hypothetical protein